MYNQRQRVEKKTNYRLLILALVAVLAIGVAVAVGRHNSKASTTKTITKQTTTPVKTQPTTTTPVDSFNKKQFSLTDPASIWVIANKQHPLSPKDYIPSNMVMPNIPLRVPGNESMQVRDVTATALESMFAAAKTENLNLMLSSGYRSYAYQVNLYNGYVKTQGQATADTQSARPGFSEHQTGLAVDVEPVTKTCELEQCFGTTPEGAWVAANAYKYGFIVRYTTGDEDITGYEPEPWHIRYIGVDLATEMHTKNIATLEQFFGVTGGKTYTNN